MFGTDWVQDAAREQVRRRARRREKAGFFERDGGLGWRGKVYEMYDAGQAWIVVTLIGTLPSAWMQMSKLIDSQASPSVSTPRSSISLQNGFQTSSGATARLASTSIRISVVGARIMVCPQRPPIVLRLMECFRLRRVASMEFFHPG